MATASDDGTTRVWDANTGQLLLTLPSTGLEVRGLAYSPNGQRLATPPDTDDRYHNPT